MKATRILQIGLKAENLDESVTFYQAVLGAHHVATYDPPGLAFFDMSGVRILLERGAPKSTIYLWVDDIDLAYGELRDRGVQFLDEPHMIMHDANGQFGAAGEEEWMCFFKDPGGNAVALATRRPHKPE